MTRRIFLDTEWTAAPWSEAPGLAWIGLADEQGRSWYGISSEVVIDPSTNAFMSCVFRLISPTEPRPGPLPRTRSRRWRHAPSLPAYTSTSRSEISPPAITTREP